MPDPGELPKGILLWRALTQWMGGMGIIVLSVAILPLLGVGGVELARAESPGPTPDRLTPRFRETAKRLWLVYVVFTVAEALLLWAGDMTLFEAIAHAFTTMSTGGFGTDVQLDGGLQLLCTMGCHRLHVPGRDLVCPSLPGPSPSPATTCAMPNSGSIPAS